MTHIVSTQKTFECIERLKELKELIEDLQKKEEKVKQQLYKIMGENDELITEDGEVIATWKYAKDTQYFDAKEFKENSPEIYELFLKKKPGSRRLILK